MKARLILLFALLGLTHLPAREWRSAAGGRTLEGDFLRLTGDQVQLKPAKGQAMTVGLALLSAEDQTFAKTAQAALGCQLMAEGPVGVHERRAEAARRGAGVLSVGALGLAVVELGTVPAPLVALDGRLQGRCTFARATA